MSKIPCSVALLTYNSEKTLRRALESVKDFDDIIILDGGSTDATRTIAHEYGARVIEQDTKFNYPGTTRLADGGGARNQMMNEAKYDWYLWIDSDENISDGLREEIRSVVQKPYKNGDPLAYRVPISICIDERPIKYSSNYPGYQFRFFNRKSGGRLVHKVHNRIDFDPGTITGTLSHPWYVYVESAEIKIFPAWKNYRKAEIETAANRTFPDFMRWIVWFHIRASGGMFLKALRNYTQHGFRDSMPIKAELARILSPLILVVNATAYRLKSARKH